MDQGRRGRVQLSFAIPDMILHTSTLTQLLVTATTRCKHLFLSLWMVRGGIGAHIHDL